MTPLLLTTLLFTFPFFGEDEPDNSLNGYVEVDYVYIAPVQNGRIDAIEVSEGEMVSAGQALFKLDDIDQRGGVAAAQAALSQAEVNERNAQTSFTRTQSLVTRKAVEAAQLDEATDAKEAAAAQVRTAKANLARAQYALEERVIYAPKAAVVEDIYYSKGEVITAGTPLMALRPDAMFKAIVYLPEPLRSGVELGEKLLVSCDGCAQDFEAVVSRIEDQPQYTPPMIFSREERGRFVYRMEAELVGDVHLTAGQPISLEFVNE